MADRTPEEIWDEGLDEGERRLARSWVALAATGFAGGTDVMFGIVAATVATAGLSSGHAPGDGSRARLAAVRPRVRVHHHRPRGTVHRELPDPGRDGVRRSRIRTRAGAHVGHHAGPELRRAGDLRPHLLRQGRASRRFPARSGDDRRHAGRSLFSRRPVERGGGGSDHDRVHVDNHGGGRCGGPDRRRAVGWFPAVRADAQPRRRRLRRDVPRAGRRDHPRGLVRLGRATSGSRCSAT